MNYTIHYSCMYLLLILKLTYNKKLWTSFGSTQEISFITDTLDTGRKLNVHKTFRRRPGRPGQQISYLCSIFVLCPGESFQLWRYFCYFYYSKPFDFEPGFLFLFSWKLMEYRLIMLLDIFAVFRFDVKVLSNINLFHITCLFLSP